VTLLTRLAHALERLTEPPVPVCAKCGAPMVLRREDPVGELPAAVQRVYACGRCGHRTTTCVLWAIPD
jgi:DNA-directed RNA polymerase subunit RPC12/RpoP